MEIRKQKEQIKKNSKYEQKLKQDLQDLQVLSSQIQKVQYLKQQHDQQKEEIISLKSEIKGLKSQNQELRALSSNKKKGVLNQKEGDIYLGSNKNDEKCESHSNRQQSPQKSKNNNIKKQRKLAQVQRTKTKLWNLKDQKFRVQNSQCPFDPNCKVQNEQMLQPSLSIRNHSSYASLNEKLSSPQTRTQTLTQTWRAKRPLRSMLLQSDEDDLSYFNQTHFQTKTKLVGELFSDIQFQLQQVSESLHTQKVSHKATKQLLQQTINQNNYLNKLTQKLSPLISQNETLQQESRDLKTQVHKLFELKNMYEAEIKQSADRLQLQSQVRKKKWQDQQKELQAMDQIYIDFIEVCNKIEKNTQNYRGLNGLSPKIFF